MPKKPCSIKRAFISVYDKTGIEDFGKDLENMGVQILSTGGTATTLRNAGVEVTDVAKYTGFPEMLDGRVKTLHPMIHGGLLYLRGNADHVAQAEEHGILPIDLVAINLYPFEKTAANEQAEMTDVIEQIDIGGPSGIRSAAKNAESVAVIVDPEDYSSVTSHLEINGDLPSYFRSNLRMKAYYTTAMYDLAIYAYLVKKRGEEDGAELIAGLRNQVKGVTRMLDIFSVAD